MIRLLRVSADPFSSHLNADMPECSGWLTLLLAREALYRVVMLSAAADESAIAIIRQERRPFGSFAAGPLRRTSELLAQLPLSIRHARRQGTPQRRQIHSGQTDTAIFSFLDLADAMPGRPANDVGNPIRWRLIR